MYMTDEHLWYEAGNLGDILHPEGDENTVDDFSLDDLIKMLQERKPI